MLQNATALVVDDSSTVRRFVATTLKTQLNCRKIIQAASGEEALEILAGNERIDWIFSDWEMPVVTGDELLLKVRSNPKTAAVPFIMITSRKDRDSLVTAAQAGVTDYLIKPFSAAGLTQKVRRISLSIERRQKARFVAESKNGVEATLTNGFKVKGGLINISETGLLMKSSIFRTELAIYDPVLLSIQAGEGVEPIQARGELLRVENDRENPGERHFVRTAYRFTAVDEPHTRRLAEFVAALSDEAPPESQID
jgi:CheY-like chemotaxis protein